MESQPCTSQSTTVGEFQLEVIDSVPTPPQFSYDTYSMDSFINYSSFSETSPSLTLNSPDSTNDNVSDVTQRRQKNDAEKQRREVLREEFEKLKSVLPEFTVPRRSKVSLLIQAVDYIRTLQKMVQELEETLRKREQEIEGYKKTYEQLTLRLLSRQ